MSTPVFIIARQRSGTNLLRRSLETSGLFKDFNEIFNLDRTGGSGRYWNFYIEAITEKPELAFPSAEHQNELLDLFLERCIKDPKPFPILDVKYNSTHHLNNVWQSPVDVPFMFKMLAQRNIPVIHLVRNNFLDTYVSSLVANKIKTWVAFEKDTVQDTTIQVNINQMLQHLTQRKRELDIYRRWFAEFRGLKSLEIVYEQIITGDNQFAPEVSEQLRKFLGIEQPLSLGVPTKKIAKPVAEVVENYQSEVVPALIKHQFEYLIAS